MPVSSANEPVCTTVPRSDAAPPPPPSAIQLVVTPPTAGIVAPRKANVPVKFRFVTPLLLPFVDQFFVPVLLIVTVPDPENVAPVAVDDVEGPAPLMLNAPPAATAPQVKLCAPVAKIVLASVL